MSADVQRRVSKGPLGWFRGKDKSHPTAGKLAKGGPRPMPVNGPRKMGIPTSVSADALAEPREPRTEPHAPQLSTSTPSSPVSATPQMWIEEPSSDSQSARTMQRVPSWASPRPVVGDWNASAAISHPRYHIHEPTGPPYYINYHLKPPPNAAPRTSFPPTLGTSSAQTTSQVSSHRFESQQSLLRGYMDDVDSLDVSDPNGTRWHHTSPYDIGRRAAPRPKSMAIGPGVGTYAGAIEGSEIVEFNPLYAPSSSSSSSLSPNRVHPRSRSSSHTRFAPSPLSQSTSVDNFGRSSMERGTSSSLPSTLPPSSSAHHPPVLIGTSTTSLHDDDPDLPLEPPDQGFKSRSSSPLKHSIEPTLSPARSSPSTLRNEPNTNSAKLSKKGSVKRPENRLFAMFGTSPQWSSKAQGGSELQPGKPNRRRSVSATAYGSQSSRARPNSHRSRRASTSGPPRETSPTKAPAAISGPTPLKPPVAKNSLNPQSSEKSEKRGSFLGRLVKKFSMMGRSSPTPLTESREIPGMQRISTDSRGASFEFPRPSQSSLVKQPVAPIPEDSSNMNQNVGSTLPSPPPSPSSELPYHLSTPKVVSTLLEDPPSPPSSPLPLMALTVANPDILVPRTPTPPRPAELLDNPDVPKAKDLNSTQAEPSLSHLSIFGHEQDSGVVPAVSRPRYTRDSKGRLERIRDEETDTWRASRGSSDSAPHHEPTPHHYRQFVSRTTVPLKSDGEPDRERAEGDYRRNDRRRHSRSRDSRYESEGSHHKRSIDHEQDNRRDKDSDGRSYTERRSRGLELESSKGISASLFKHDGEGKLKGDSEKTTTKHQSLATDDEISGSTAPSPSKRERKRGDASSSAGQSHSRGGNNGQSDDPVPLPSSHDRAEDDKKEARRRRREEREKEREERQRARERAVAQSPTKTRPSRSSDKERKNPDDRGNVNAGSEAQTSPLAIHERPSRDQGESSAAESSSTPQGKHPTRAFPAVQSSGWSSDQSTPPISGVTRSRPTRRKQPSIETISALGKEWEVVPEPSKRHRSSSRSRSRATSDQEKLRDAVRAMMESSSSGSPTHKKSITRQIIKIRRSLSADSLVTSSSRVPPTVPPTPPPKLSAPRDTRPPTARRPSVARRANTPSSRGSSPSPTLDKFSISPTSIQRISHESQPKASLSLVSPSSRPPSTPLSKPSSSEPIRSRTSRRGYHHASASSEDVTRPLRGIEIKASNDWDQQRAKKGQSWSVTDVANEEDRRLQLHLAVIPTNGQKATDNSATGLAKGTSVDRVGSSHTSFRLQAPLAPIPAAKHYATAPPHPPERSNTMPVASTHGYYTHSPYYSHALSQAQGSATYYTHLQYTPSPSASPCPHPSALQAYQTSPTSHPASSPYQYAHMLAYTPSSSATHLPSTSQQHPPNLHSYPSHHGTRANVPARPGTYVQFSSRASYPIAQFPQPPYPASSPQWSNQSSAHQP
ncbi:uncharacterized protein EI90DRAFT_2540822 [Cantharellus anzutake]|uniref:uncharacterized protein n=1 Tax=Cantharellus anzutake TaxID=1750568 RepID=UPI0019089A75|nr:uncharacterized protein EI90DRAFT_2540822 [Cantharellus anzutake]KAF8338103.1 hypothetical protein EI90DRAFT_2540822 [Cantharellus anzutake]